MTWHLDSGPDMIAHLSSVWYDAPSQSESPTLFFYNEYPVFNLRLLLTQKSVVGMTPTRLRARHAASRAPSPAPDTAYHLNGICWIKESIPLHNSHLGWPSPASSLQWRGCDWEVICSSNQNSTTRSSDILQVLPLSSEEDMGMPRKHLLPNLLQPLSTSHRAHRFTSYVSVVQVERNS